MQYTILSRMILGILLFGSSGFVVASESDKLQEQVKEIRKEAAAIAERGKKEAELGNKEQAERFKKEAIKLQEAAERTMLKAKERGDSVTSPRGDKEVQQLRDRHQELLARERKLKNAKAPEKELAEVREQIAEASRELHMRMVGHKELPQELHAHAEKLEVASRRIHHLKVAAENLKMAEVNDLAHDLMEKAELMEREVLEGKKRLEAEIQNIHRRGHGLEHAPDVVQELKREIEHLRAELNELRQKIEKH